jgi:hypothetical protein
MAIGMATPVGAAQDLGLSNVGDLLTTQLNETNATRKRKANQKSPLAAIQGDVGAASDLMSPAKMFAGGY